MNKATFVNEIPTKIEGNEVPTLNLVKSLLTSENISDRITEFRTASNAKSVEVILPEGSKFKVGAEIANSIPITIENCNGFVIKANDQTCEIDENTNLFRGVCAIQALDVNNSEHLSLLTNRVDKDYVLEFSNFKIDGVDENYTETINILSNGPTDMSSSRLMTANSVKGYVQDEITSLDTKFAQKNHDHQSEIIIDSIREYTTDDLYVSVSGNVFKATEDGVKISKTEYENFAIVKFDVFIENTSYGFQRKHYEGYSASIFEDYNLSEYRTEDAEGNYIFKLPQSNSSICRIEFSVIGSDSGNRFIISRGPTDMNSKERVISANALKMYVDVRVNEILKEKQLIS